jgi:predicted site-specific integrase-resolvase
MPNTNGHVPKRAILYARVSTDEQARSGYSLAQQIEALRAHAASEGYEVLEEVQDTGQSGASLERPGMDRVRDLVAGGGVYVVLWHRTGTVSPGSQRITTFSGASSRSTGLGYAPSTTGETIA